MSYLCSINGSLLDLGLIDEVSMMYGYGIDGREGMAAAFDGRPMERKQEPIPYKAHWLMQVIKESSLRMAKSI
ncbi:MAG: hypothetical protein IJ064_08140 [Bacteroidaceae bacterium]|nr:hypothetical protein [Bacteroidaceae bacterium]